MKRLVVLIVMIISIISFSYAQDCSACLNCDCDGDGINDKLEQRLAEKFAPEWRFNKEIEGIDSRQNKTEKFYPSSIEHWFDEINKTQDKPPILFQYIDVDGPFGHRIVYKPPN